MSMTTRLHQRGHPGFLNTLAEIFQLYPPTDYTQLVPRRSAAQRMADAWTRTNQQMESALTKIQHRYSLAERPKDQR